jgi:hypothetical protein
MRNKIINKYKFFNQNHVKGVGRDVYSQPKLLSSPTYY